jgi:trehalose 6-phosphate phosphatase
MISLMPQDALFLDFDGTLTELGPDPDAIRLDPAMAEALARLAAALDGALVLISGRDLRDLAKRTPDGLWRAGGHGLEVLEPGGSLPAAPAGPDPRLLGPLRAVEAAQDGVRLELKGPVAALHFRAAPEAEAATIAAARDAAASVPGHVWQAGKMVVEVKPEAAHKGHALRAMMERPGFVGRRPVMIGDDTTDEDAIEAAQDLGGIGVKIGDGASAARIRMDDPAALGAWLAGEAARLGAQPKASGSEALRRAT